jgi:phosphoenolpyruvate carboxylase
MPEDIMLRARRSMSDRERDVTRFLAELHRRIEETQALEQKLREQLEAAWSGTIRNWRANGRSARPPS